MAEIPGKYLKYAPIDWDGEIFAGMGLPVSISGHEFFPLTFGVMQLLEIIESKVVKDPENCDMLDTMRMLFILGNREDAVKDVAGYVPFRDNPAPFEDREKWAPFDKTAAYWVSRTCSPTPFKASDFNKMINVAFAGYAMIPGKESGSEYVFGEDAFASTLMVCESLQASPFEIRWRIPLVTIGHMAAVKYTANGGKGVDRPKDEEDIKQKFSEYYEREKSGKLHPWQIDRPDLYHLSDMQYQSIDCIEAYNKCVDDFREKLGSVQHGRN